MCLRLMITRPQDDARQLADELELLGVKYLIAPLLSIEVIKTKPPNLEGVQALLLTSANGVRAFANLSKERKIPIYAVGDASAFAAHKVGFEKNESAGGDVAIHVLEDGAAIVHLLVQVHCRDEVLSCRLLVICSRGCCFFFEEICSLRWHALGGHQPPGRLHCRLA